MREWKDYDDELDYEDLISVQKETYTHDQMPNHQKRGINRLNTTMHIIDVSIGRLLGTAIVVFAISTLVAIFTTKLPNTKGVIEFKISEVGIED